MENKDLEFILKNEVSNFIKTNIEDYVNSYYQLHSNDIGFLLYYPLITLEKNFFISGTPELFQSHRVAISWFIKELIKKDYNQDLVFTYIEAAREEYERKHHQNILNIYERKVFSEEVTVMNPAIGYQLSEITDNSVEVTKPYISNQYNEKKIYYHLLQDDQQNQIEISSAENLTGYILQTYIKIPPTHESMNKLILLPDIFDQELYNLCEERVSVDLDKLGGNIKSRVVRNLNELKKVISSLHYICQVKHTTQFLPGSKWYIEYDYIDLIDKMARISGITLDTIERYINFFTLDASFEGTITNFPLIRYHNRIIIIPSSILLNDFHFNIVNGHYYKGNIQFTNRDKTISKSIVSQIVSKAAQFSNVLYSEERAYSFVGEDNTPEQSDIDVAIYDKNSNKLLVIECKWINNHFTSEEERHIKVYNTLRDVYSDQINKHTKFLSLGKSSLLHLFKNDPIVQGLTSMPDIHYIVLDKRSQFHIENKHMLTVYLLLYLFNEFKRGNELLLDPLINEIESLRTDVTFTENSKSNAPIIEIKGLKYTFND